MVNLILLEISLILMLLYFLSKLRHGIHMFQLESYRPERYKRWMSKNKEDLFNIRELLFIIPIIILPFHEKGALIAQIVIIVLMWLSRNIYKEKKPLVITKRVKRLYITAILLIGILIAINNLLFIKCGILWQILGLLAYDLSVFFSMYWIFLIYMINLPVENLIHRKFYNMAKRKIENMKTLKIIGITGSYGKTSTKYILSTILNQKFNVCITPGNFNTLLGVERTINENLKPTDQIFLCEMGAKNIGDIKEICDLVHPTYGILTSIGPQHLETFKTLENVKKTKMELIEAIPQEGEAFVNYEDENIKEINIERHVNKYGIGEKCDVYAYDIQMSAEGAMFNVHTPNEEIKGIKTKLLGENNIINVAGAVSVATKLGMTPQEIKMGISHLQPIEHRLELRRSANGLLIIDDAYNSNIKGATKAFETLKLFKNKTRIIVTPGLVELGEDTEKYNKELGEKAAECADFVILVGKKQAPPIKEGLLNKRYAEDKIWVAENINEAIKKWGEFPPAETVILLENDLPDNYL